MSEESELRAQLRGQIQRTEPSELLAHQRRDALLIAQPSIDILDVAVAIAEDDTARIAAYLGSGEVYKPVLTQLTDWCVEPGFRLQFVILQPYVLAQPILAPDQASS